MIPDFATVEEKRELSSRLALLYLDKTDISGLSPTELAKKYFEVKAEVKLVVDAHP